MFVLINFELNILLSKYLESVLTLLNSTEMFGKFYCHNSCWHTIVYTAFLLRHSNKKSISVLKMSLEFH